MKNLSGEQMAQLIQAQSAGEVAEWLREAGGDEALAERVWAELTHRRGTDGKELSLDELEAVSGGKTYDWAAEGCSATVRPGSWCWSSDNCAVVIENYDNPPLHDTCPECGTYLYEYLETVPPWQKIPKYYVCKSCGYREFKGYT